MNKLAQINVFILFEIAIILPLVLMNTITLPLFYYRPTSQDSQTLKQEIYIPVSLWFCPSWICLASSFAVVIHKTIQAFILRYNQLFYMHGPPADNKEKQLE